MTPITIPKYRCAFAAAFILLLFSAQLSAQPSIRLFQSTSRSAKSSTVFSTHSTYLSVDREALASVLNRSAFILTSVPLPHIDGLPQSADLDLTEFSVITEKTRVI